MLKRVNTITWVKFVTFLKTYFLEKVEVALSLDKKFKKVIGSDGYARFNITGEFEQREQERLQSKG